MSPHFARVAKEVYGYKNVHYMVAGHKTWQGTINPYYTEPEFLKMAQEEGMAYILIDLRSSAKAKREHIKGAVNFPAEDNLQKAAKALSKALSKKLKKSARIIYYADDPEVAVEMHRTMRANYVKEGYILNGGIAAWKAKGYPTTSGQLAGKISYKGKKNLPGALKIKDFEKIVTSPHADTLVVDVRSPGEWLKTGIVPGALTIPLDTLHQRWQEVPRNKKIITHCKAGNRALQAWRLLTSKGYKNVRWVNGKVAKFSKGILKKGIY